MKIVTAKAGEQNEIRIENYIENVVYHSSPETFESHFRVLWDAYIAFGNSIGLIIHCGKNNEHLPIPIRNEIVPVLWLLGTPKSYR